MDIFGANIPFAAHCGIEPIGFEDGRTRLRVRAAPEHTNNLGIAHGGLICTLLDIAMGTAARCTVGAPVMTLDMQASFLSPGRGEMTAEGRVLRAGRSTSSARRRSARRRASSSPRRAACSSPSRPRAAHRGAAERLARRGARLISVFLRILRGSHDSRTRPHLRLQARPHRLAA